MMMKKLLVIMPMAGEGKRFAQTGEQTLKPFIKVDDEYMFVKAMNSVRSMFKDYEIYFELVVLRDVAHKYNLDDIVSNMQNTYICKLYKKTIGPAETVLYGCKDILKQCDDVALFYDELQTIVLDCDFEVKCEEYKRFVDINGIFSRRPVDCILLTHYETNPRYSYVKLLENLKVSDIAEKRVISEHAIIGTYCFSSLKVLRKYIEKLFEKMQYFLGSRKEPYISDVVKCMLQDDLNVVASQIHEGDIYNSFGTPQELEEYKNKENDESDNY